MTGRGALRLVTEEPPTPYEVVCDARELQRRDIEVGSAASIATPEENNAGWKLRGLCRYLDPDCFFPERGAGDKKYKTEIARMACAYCAVRDRCFIEDVYKSDEFDPVDCIIAGFDRRERKRVKEDLAARGR